MSNEGFIHDISNYISSIHATAHWVKLIDPNVTNIDPVKQCLILRVRLVDAQGIFRSKIVNNFACS